jgi:putative hydrolase of the HAD superfamily
MGHDACPAAARLRQADAENRVVIFDAFNTLVRPVAGASGTFGEALERADIAPTPEMLARLQRASAGLDHRDRSRNRSEYAEWTDATLAGLGPATLAELEPAVIPALEQCHQAQMEQFPDVGSCLAALRAAGVAIAVCSNWGWDLARDLDLAGLAGLVDIALSSASAGCRKPHPVIYERVLELAGVSAAEAVFVGDDLSADVLGPRRAGISSVLLDRPGTSGHGVVSIRSLAELPAIVAGRLPA